MKILMVKGSSLIPQRFWDYKIATSFKEAYDLEKQGYVKSNLKERL